ncbi:T6SS phospholipase effector Tle1-like catalytic domain-containing protein [Acinetobacter seifertii]|uniref:T6SS phospholipase effector Tle1-like catalytic domain-containing protein n=1 Tax=Acinetobacter seifertii TaxID=1530123 RepID=UPI00168CFF3D|nr:DUF2235 domain-containing protein [Acinetobacter seifertii]MDV4265321.1 DUF2235 domain-containing protein [Acinetobacter seifertii]QNY05678.1 DUF2235 domain-containing protein [Acinetobacter seifertii]
MISDNLQRVVNLNNDISNDQPSSKQDCHDVVNISVFFDGTGNNEDADKKEKKWSNPARLWRNAQTLRDKEMADKNTKISPNYAIYISGVGTRFNAELNIFQRAISSFQDHYSLLGMGVGLGGARRLDYGEDQLNDALKQILTFNAQKVEKDVKKYVGEKKNYSFAEVDKNLKDHRLIKKINISVFGFSRGAALARAFTNQFIGQCESNCDGLTYGQGKYPIEFKFLGIFDTVASFGLPATNLSNSLPFLERDLVVDERVQNCSHYIAGNEVRFAFPVDVIHKDNKLANSNWKEVVYPGVHSDVGGGYEPGGQGVNDNFARIPLKHMLDDALQAGVKMYSYDELKKGHSEVFEQFEIQPDSQKYYDAVKAATPSQGSVQEQIKGCMKLYYSAYGTIARAGNELSVSQRVRQENKFREYIPVGPSDMATEMQRLKKLKEATASKKDGFNIFRVFSPVSTAYEYMISIEDWQFESWNKDVSDDIKQFYLNYVHDSKYGFLSNVEPFSYFRQRRVYESRRSASGEERDKKTAEQKVTCSAPKQEIPQTQFIDAYEQAQQTDNFLNAS